MASALLAVALACIPVKAAEIRSALMSEDEVVHRTDLLLAQMTLQEKVGQLNQVGINLPGPHNESTEELVRSGQAGSVLWTIDSERILKLQKIAMQESRMKIPLLFGFDVIHGYKTVFPIPLGMAASWDPSLMEKAQAIAAHEASVSGINWNFSPMVDIARDARWGRMLEGAGEDTYLGCAMARAQVRGIQGPALGTPGHMLACVKHFAGYGAGEGGRDYDSCYIPDVLLQNVYLPPYKAAIDEGAGSVMSAYMCLNDVPATGNTWLMQDILRRQMGFKGLTISDSWSIASLTAHGYARDPNEAAVRAIRAGIAVDMGSQTYLNTLPVLVGTDRVAMKEIDELTREVLAAKLRMGLFEKPYPDLATKDKVLSNPEHRAVARLAAQKSIVLLRNEQNLLPLKTSVSSVALIGPLADSTEEIKGSWTCEGGAAISVLEGLRNKLPNTRIDVVHGGDMQRAYPMPWDAKNGIKAPAIMAEEDMKREVGKAVEAARNAEVVIIVLGERANMSGEAASSASLALGGNQMELLRAVAGVGKPVVLVLLNGRPLDITWASEHVPAIVEAWFPGTEGGNAIADVLLGDANPAGRLPISWPRSAGQSPTYYGHNNTQAHEDDPAFTSRYADQSSLPLYPFGHGLSYSRFEYSDLRIDNALIGSDGQVRVSITVTNTSQVDGDEVVQLYIHQQAGSAARPVRQLKGFRRIHLQAGARQDLEFTLGRPELEFWSPESKSWVVERETFDVWVGGDSLAKSHAEFRVK